MFNYTQTLGLKQIMDGDYNTATVENSMKAISQKLKTEPP